MIAALTELLIVLLLVVGGAFGLIGSWGLVKLPDAMTRLHAPTKSATLGVGCVLLAGMLNHRLAAGAWSWHELLIFLFIALTAPVTALFIAKANMHQTWPRDAIPRPAPRVEWSTYANPEAQPEEVAARGGPAARRPDAANDRDQGCE